MLPPWQPIVPSRFALASLRPAAVWMACVVLMTANADTSRASEPEKEAGKQRPAPTRFEPSIETIEKRYANTDSQDVDVVFIGSSSIRMWDLAESFPGLGCVNCGFGGSHLADSTHYADRLVKRFAPTCIVLYAGDNDIANGLSESQVVQDFSACMQAFESAAPGTKILYVAIKPSRKRFSMWPAMQRVNTKIQALTETNPNWYFVDIAHPMLATVRTENKAPPSEWFASDGLHLSKKGYALWTECVRKQLAKALGSEKTRAPAVVPAVTP